MGKLDQKKYKTYSYRIKDAGSCKALHGFAYDVNQIWNYCCASGRHTVKHNQKWLSKAQLYAGTKGSSKEIGINAQTIQAIVETFCDKRMAARRPSLKWRKSTGVRRSLGWVPFKNQTISVSGSKVIYCGIIFHFWCHREIIGRIICGSFSE